MSGCNPRPRCKLLKVRRLVDTGTRPNYVNNGAAIRGAVPFTPNIKSQVNLLAGFYKRPSWCHPIDWALREQFKWFVNNVYCDWLREHKSPFVLEPIEVIISRLNVPAPMKAQFTEYYREVQARGFQLSDDELLTGFFIKLEFYEDPKYPRVIMPESERARIAFQDVVHGMTHAILTLPSCIKSISFDDRPEFLRNLFGLVPVSSNDFSSFESSNDLWMLLNIITPIYRVLCDGNDEGKLDLFLNYAARDLRFRGMDMDCVSDPALSSGKIDTALRNLVLNDAALAFAAWLVGADNTRVVEGDDSVFARIPGVENVFKGLGFTAKLENHDSINDAAFCRAYCGGRANLTDAVYSVIKLGWSDAQYLGAKCEKKLGLLKAKAMSYLIQYCGCPIIGPVVDYLLCKLENIDEVTPRDWWEFEKFKFWKPELRGKSVLEVDRLEYERLFRVGVDEQKAIESELIKSISETNWENLLESPTLICVIERTRPSWISNWDKSVRYVPITGRIEAMDYLREGPCVDGDFENMLHSMY